MWLNININVLNDFKNVNGNSSLEMSNTYSILNGDRICYNLLASIQLTSSCRLMLIDLIFIFSHGERFLGYYFYFILSIQYHI